MNKLSPELLNSANATTLRHRERIAALRATLANIERDPERVKRLTQNTCAVCWYETGGMSGQAFSDWTCRVCGDKYSHPNTATPRVCQSCAQKHRLCHDCGGDIEMKTRRFVREKMKP